MAHTKTNTAGIMVAAANVRQNGRRKNKSAHPHAQRTNASETKRDEVRKRKRDQCNATGKHPRNTRAQQAQFMAATIDPFRCARRDITRMRHNTPHSSTDAIAPSRPHRKSSLTLVLFRVLLLLSSRVYETITYLI